MNGKGFHRILAGAALSLLLVCPAFGAAKFHIGVMTPTVSQAEDNVRGAETLMAKYGNADKGGMIKHITHPDNFMSEMETVISQIVGLADDPLMKVIVVNQAIPGTTEAFRRVKEKRKDILCIAGEPHEDPGVIDSAADVAVNVDNIARGYLIIAAAKKLGADTFVHISFPRHMSYELLSRRRNIMEVACKDLGMKFVFETAPDPTSDVGVAGAQQFILEKVPAWLQKYGKKSAFFCTNDAQAEPLIKQVAALGGYFVEADLPSPLSYAGALSMDLSKEKGNWTAILKKVEQAVIKAGGKGRLGTWVYSNGYVTTAALAEFGKLVVEKKAKVHDFKTLMACLNRYSPGGSWSGNPYVDLGTGVKQKNHFLIYQDTYIFGRGYLGMTKVKVPEKYFQIR